MIVPALRFSIPYGYRTQVDIVNGSTPNLLGPDEQVGQVAMHCASRTSAPEMLLRPNRKRQCGWGWTVSRQHADLRKTREAEGRNLSEASPNTLVLVLVRPLAATSAGGKQDS